MPIFRLYLKDFSRQLLHTCVRFWIQVEFSATKSNTTPPLKKVDLKLLCNDFFLRSSSTTIGNLDFNFYLFSLFVPRDCFHDSHPHTMIPDPMYPSVPFPLMPQLGVNSRCQFPKMGCRSQDKASFFQSGDYRSVQSQHKDSGN